jgi:hypothetical protein
VPRSLWLTSWQHVQFFCQTDVCNSECISEFQLIKLYDLFNVSLLLIKAQTWWDTINLNHQTHVIKRSKMSQCWAQLNIYSKPTSHNTRWPHLCVNLASYGNCLLSIMYQVINPKISATIPIALSQAHNHCAAARQDPSTAALAGSTPTR